jgi:NADPH:quinone reductase-like Zn-dependent oxidoreductase
MSDQIKAIVVDAKAPGRLSVQTVSLAPAQPADVTVRVTAISLNRGETKRAVTQSEPGARPGWDFAGVVEEAAKQGGGPPVGARVVGYLLSGAWAERIRVPVQNVAVLPDGVTDAQASTLPVAGLTALHALRQGGLLLGQKVLIDGASGGVGHIAVQLAAASGAIVCGHVRREELKKAVSAWCNGGVAVGASIEAARSLGPFHLILDSVGGQTLATALTLLRDRGTCVTFGISEAPTSTFESGNFFRLGGVRLYGLYIFEELARVEPASTGLALLADLVRRKVLVPSIEVEAPWTDIGRIATDLLDRKFAGKAVLYVK